MSFGGDVHALIREIFPVEYESEDDMAPFLSQELILFLRQVQGFRPIRDRVLFYAQNKYRFYDTYICTKFLTDKINISHTLEELVSNLQIPFLCFIGEGFSIKKKLFFERN